MSENSYSEDILASGISPDRREGEAQAIERAQRERDDAKDELRAEWRTTTRWALVVMGLLTTVMGVLTTITIAISAMGMFQISGFNAELRDVRDSLTVLEERMRHLNNQVPFP